MGGGGGWWEGGRGGGGGAGGGNSHMKKLDLPFGKWEDQSLYDPRNTPF